MSNLSATALAHPNIAFIKYWGNRDAFLRIPVNGSISMNLEGLYTITEVCFTPGLYKDELILNRKHAAPEAVQRVGHILDLVRSMSNMTLAARVSSENNFPTGAGIASSAAAFAALALAAAKAAGLNLDQTALSRLARRGSGSACRSVPGGFVEWLPGDEDLNSYAISIAPPEHWDLVDCIAIAQEAHKPVGSTAGHTLAGTSPLQSARVADAPRRLDLCRSAILSHDFEALAAVTEQDSNLMHAVMMTSSPALFYWEPTSLEIIKTIPQWRNRGWPVCYTLDAGPNVHVLTTKPYVDRVKNALMQFQGVKTVLVAAAAGPARIVQTGL